MPNDSFGIVLPFYSTRVIYMKKYLPHLFFQNCHRLKLCTTVFIRCAIIIISFGCCYRLLLFLVTLFFSPLSYRLVCNFLENENTYFKFNYSLTFASSTCIEFFITEMKCVLNVIFFKSLVVVLQNQTIHT